MRMVFPSIALLGGGALYLWSRSAKAAAAADGNAAGAIAGPPAGPLAQDDADPVAFTAVVAPGDDLQAAVEAALARGLSDTSVLLLPGEHKGPLFLMLGNTKGRTLSIFGRGSATIAAGSPGDCALDHPARYLEEVSAVEIVGSGANVTLDRVRLLRRDSGRGGPGGNSLVVRAGVVRLQGCALVTELRPVFSASSLYYVPACARVEGSSTTAVFEGCEISDSRYTGLAAISGARAQLVRCRLEGNSHSGVFAALEASVELKHCQVAGNLVAGIHVVEPASVRADATNTIFSNGFC